MGINTSVGISAAATGGQNGKGDSVFAVGMVQMLTAVVRAQYILCGREVPLSA